MFIAKLKAVMKARKEEARRLEFEEMRRISDNFGWGPILRYGEDRYGSLSATQVAEAA